MGYLAVRTPEISCAPFETALSVPDSDSFTPCFSAATHGAYPNAVFRYSHVTPDGELFLASATGVSDTPPLIWRLLLDTDGTVLLEDVKVAGVTSDPLHFLVAGGSIFRSTREGLYIHSKDDFDQEWGWTHFDVDGNAEISGPPVEETAVLGSSAVLAAGDEGIIVLSLSCR